MKTHPLKPTKISRERAAEILYASVRKKKKSKVNRGVGTWNRITKSSFSSANRAVLASAVPENALILHLAAPANSETVAALRVLLTDPWGSIPIYEIPIPIRPLLAEYISNMLQSNPKPEKEDTAAIKEISNQFLKGKLRNWTISAYQDVGDGNRYFAELVREPVYFPKKKKFRAVEAYLLNFDPNEPGHDKLKSIFRAKRYLAERLILRLE